jgi:hypothetical protein
MVRRSDAQRLALFDAAAVPLLYETFRPFGRLPDPSGCSPPQPVDEQLAVRGRVKPVEQTRRADAFVLLVKVPLKMEFWGALHGQIEDKFGVLWMITTEAKANPL